MHFGGFSVYFLNRGEKVITVKIASQKLQESKEIKAQENFHKLLKNFFFVLASIHFES